jgi:Iap family predicted aminopeptidase
MFLDAGVAGLIFVAGKNHLGGIPQAYYNYKRWYGGDTPPSVIITYADCQVLKSLRPVQAKIAVAGQVEWGKSANVYAEIRGARMPEETIVIGAHRDSTATSPGASDDAAGCALVLELARAFLQTGLPQRTLRFILYGGHETGLHGCENWLHRRVDQIQKIMACINFDVHGVLEGEDHASALGSDQWVNLIRRCTKTIPRPLQIEIEPREVDMMAYASLGIPSVNFARYGIPRYHTNADGLQGTGPEGLESGLLFGGSLLADLADYQEPLNFGKFPWERLKASREFAELWGWGII